MAQTFSDGAMVKLGWRKTLDNLGLLLGALFISVVVVLIPIALASVVDNGLLGFLLFLAYMFLALFMTIGYIRLTIAIADGKKADLNILFKGVDVVIPYLFTIILYGLIVMLGYFLLIIPGVIWSLKFMFAPYLAIDQKLGPIEALKKSSEMTNGVKWDLFGFWHVLSAVNFLGMIVIYIGLFVSVPVTMIALAGTYRHLGPKSAKS